MHSDTYIKTVLTVIAVALIWICVRDVAVVKPAHAASDIIGACALQSAINNDADTFYGKAGFGNGRGQNNFSKSCRRGKDCLILIFE